MPPVEKVVQGGPEIFFVSRSVRLKQPGPVRDPSYGRCGGGASKPTFPGKSRNRRPDEHALGRPAGSWAIAAGPNPDTRTRPMKLEEALPSFALPDDPHAFRRHWRRPVRG